MFGRPCDAIEDDTVVIETSAPPDIDVHLQVEMLWWAELQWFAPRSAIGVMMGCWGDPTEAPISEVSAGDCNDDSASAGRDLHEGPSDLLVTFNDADPDCSRYYDRIDNNCDGRIDCDDPSCGHG